MAKETPLYKFPYPEDADAPNGPAQIKALAEAVETEVTAVLATKWDSAHLKPTILGKDSTSNTALSNGSDVDINGTSQSFTLPVKSLLLIQATFVTYILIPSTGREEFLGKIKIDGTESGKAARQRYEYPGGGLSFGTELSASVANFVELAAGEHTIKMSGRITNAIGSTFRTVSPYTGWQALVVAA